MLLRCSFVFLAHLHILFLFITMCLHFSYSLCEVTCLYALHTLKYIFDSVLCVVVRFSRIGYTALHWFHNVLVSCCRIMHVFYEVLVSCM